VDCYFDRRESEDEPAIARVDTRELQDLSEEVSIRFGVRTIQDDVGSGDRARPPLTPTPSIKGVGPPIHGVPRSETAYRGRTPEEEGSFPAPESVRL
jgi:hypothetical protein